MVDAHGAVGFPRQLHDQVATCQTADSAFAVTTNFAIAIAIMVSHSRFPFTWTTYNAFMGVLLIQTRATREVARDALMFKKGIYVAFGAPCARVWCKARDAFEPVIGFSSKPVRLDRL